MDPESKKLLEENLELSQENNNMLHSMRRSQRIASFMSFVYWILIIGSAVGVFYFVQPYVDQFKSIVEGANGVIKNVKDLKLPSSN